MQYRFSRRVEGIGPSLIRQMFNYASEVPNSVSLGVGIPPFEMPQYVKGRLAEAVNSDPHVNKYTLGNGLPPLNEAFARKLEKKGVYADPKREVLTTAGAAGGIFCTFMALIDDGDEVVLLSPAYSNHISVTRFAGGVPIHIPLAEDKGWKVEPELVEDTITPRTKALVVCNPSNPTGTVFPKEDLLRIGEIAKERGVVVFEDNAYDSIVYEGEHFSLASNPDFKDNVVAFFSSSKEHAMTGLRIGWVVANSKVIDRVFAVQDQNYICPPSLSQYAALAAMQGPQNHVEEFRQEFARRRELMCQRLDKIGFEYQRPQGAYYVFPKLPEGILEKEPRNKKAWERFREIPEEFRTADTAVALDLLFDEGVVTVPGISCGPYGENHLRFSFAAEEKHINEAFDRTERWLRRR